MSQQINITIKPDGSTSVDVDGMQGESCATATQQIELILGGGGRRKEKPEFHMPDLPSIATVSNGPGRL